MKKFITLCLLVMLYTQTQAAENYICEFGSRVKHRNLDAQNPQVKVEKGVSKYTFMVGDAGDAKYINMTDGVPAPVLVKRAANRTIFLEDNYSDNQFIVTVFLSKSNTQSKPALFTFHGWVNQSDPDFFMPETAVGRCTVTSK